MTKQTRSHLDSLKIPYDYVNIEEDEQAREWVRRQNGGKEKKPTVDVGGEILSEPSDTELDEALQRRQVVR